MIYIILVLLLVLFFLFFFCLFLLKNIKKLSKKVCELELSLDLEKKSQDISKIKELSISDKVELREISRDIDDAILDYETRKEKDDVKNNCGYQFSGNDEFFNKPYCRNRLDTIPNNLSAIGIYNNDINLKNKKGIDEVVMEVVGSRVNLNDFIKRESEFHEDIKVEKEESNNNISFLEEISREIEKELGPQTIELTDYEKEQEENAIISYKELLKVREQLYEINESSENEQFISELRNFRNNLD